MTELLCVCFSRSLFCCVKPAVERDLSPPSIDVEVQVKLTFYSLKGGKNIFHMKAASKEKIVAAFKKFDKNGDGVIDWDEFQQVMT